MPRDSQGNYSLPPGTIVSSGDTILPSQHNPAMQDIAQGLGNSLDRNGTGGMRAPLNMGGYTVQNAAPGSLSNDLATVGQARHFSVPIGAFLDFAGTTAPPGYMFPYGQAISRTTYADLFALIGTTFGGGDGFSTFNLPDIRGRVVAGKDNMGGTSANRLSVVLDGDVLGTSGGAERHTLTSGEMPSHGHTVNDPGHTHLYTQWNQIGGGVYQGSGSNGFASNAGTAPNTTGISINSTGGGGAHNNVQPTIILNKIIKVEAV